MYIEFEFHENRATYASIGAADIALYDESIMGIQIRKSIRVGPFRFNLSNSGIGVSTGIRGLRVGTGPRGTYIHMGRGGLYYRRMLSNSTAPRPPHRTPQSVVVPSHTGSHGPMYSIGSGDVSKMIDSNFAELLDEIETKRQLIVFWPIMLAATILVGAGLLMIQAQIWIQITALFS